MGEEKGSPVDELMVFVFLFFFCERVERGIFCHFY